MKTHTPGADPSEKHQKLDSPQFLPRHQVKKQ